MRLPLLRMSLFLAKALAWAFSRRIRGVNFAASSSTGCYLMGSQCSYPWKAAGYVEVIPIVVSKTERLAPSTKAQSSFKGSLKRVVLRGSLIWETVHPFSCPPPSGSILRQPRWFLTLHTGSGRVLASGQRRRCRRAGWGQQLRNRRMMAVLPGTVEIKGSLPARESPGRRGCFFLQLMLCFFDYNLQVFFPSWLIKLRGLKRTRRENVGLLQLSIVSKLALWNTGDSCSLEK